MAGSLKKQATRYRLKVSCISMMLHFRTSENQNVPINDTPNPFLDTLILSRFGSAIVFFYVPFFDKLTNAKQT